MPQKRNGRPPAPARNTSDYRILANSNTKTNNAPSLSLQARRGSEARRLRRQRYAQRIWPLGDRVLFELVDHIADRFGLEDEVDRLLDRFAGLSPDILRAVGADRLAAPPIREVRR
jgi:hypothetical protein